MASATFYASDVDDHACMGHDEDPDVAYATAHDASESDTCGNGGPNITLGQRSHVYLGWQMYIRRALMWFDTSTLTGEVPISALLRLRLRKYTGGFFDWYLKIRAGSDLAALTAGERSNFPLLLTYGTEIASKYVDDITTSIGVDYYFAVPISYISKTGLTGFSMLSSRDLSSTRPSTNGDSLELIYHYFRTTTNPMLSVVYASDPGFIWVDGRRLYFISEVNKQHIRGLYAGSGATAGHLTVEGLYLVYIDESGHKRRGKGRKEGATGKTAGHISIEHTKVRYIDASGNERYLPITWFNTTGFNGAIFNK